MNAIILTAVANLFVGTCAGLTGIAGFLLPMFYISVLSLSPIEALALSFSAFALSGLLACPAYRATNNLPLRPVIWLGAGSFAGALAGVRVGLVLPPDVLKTILYLVVFCSGASLLVRMRPRRAASSKPAKPNSPVTSDAATEKPVLLAILGFATAVVCAASGAGGPVLVVPLLLLMGTGPRTAVGMSLLDSVLIAVPSAAGYLASGSMSATSWALLPAALVANGIGMVAGSRWSYRINADLLKAIVAVGSVVVAAVKLLGF